MLCAIAANVMLSTVKVGAAPLTTLWSSAFTSAIDVSSESIRAPAAVTFVVSVTSVPASTPVVAPAVKLAAVPVKLVATPDAGVPSAGLICNALDARSPSAPVA